MTQIINPKFLQRCFRPKYKDLVAAKKLRVKGFYLKKIESISNHQTIPGKIKCLTKANLDFSQTNSRYWNSLKTSYSLKNVTLNLDSEKTNIRILKKLAKGLRVIKIRFICSEYSRPFLGKIYKILRYFQNLQVYDSDIVYSYSDPIFKECHQIFLQNLQITLNTNCDLLRQYFNVTQITQFNTKKCYPHRKIMLPLKLQDLFPNLISLTLRLIQDHPKSFYTSLQESFPYLTSLKNFHLKANTRSPEITEFLSSKQLLSLPLLDSLKIYLPFVSGSEMDLFNFLLQKQTDLINLSIIIPEGELHPSDSLKKLRFLELSSSNSLPFILSQSLANLESLTLSNLKDEFLDPQRVIHFCEFLTKQKETLRSLVLGFGVVPETNALNSLLISISKLGQLKELNLSSIHLSSTEDFQLKPTLLKLQKLENLKLSFRENESENENSCLSQILGILQGLSSLKALKTLSFNFPVSKVPGYMEYMIQNALSKLENLTMVAIETSCIFDDDDEEYLRKIVAKINLKQSQKSILMF